MSESKSSRPIRVVRMWHPQNDDWCHAFDVEDSAYRSWKEGKGPLSAGSVFLPDGKHPGVGSQVSCGTCKSTRIRPPEMKQEFMLL